MKTTVWLWAAIFAACTVQAQPRYVPPTYDTPYVMPSRPIPSIGEAPPYLGYMSPRCAALHDAIRTGPARGLNYDTMNSNRREYSRECNENESEARQQYYRDVQEGKMVKRREQQAQAVASERARQLAQQCEESKRILKMKKARTDLTEGERADLQRFEENYRARCP